MVSPAYRSPLDPFAERRAGLAQSAIKTALGRLDVPRDDMELAMLRQTPDPAIRALDNTGFIEVVHSRLLPVLAEQYGRGAVNEGRVGRVVVKANTARLNFTFDLKNPRVVRWANDNVANLITETTKRTQASIRALVIQALQHGGHPYVLADQIRPLIGLHEQYATAVLRYEQSLTDAGQLPLSRIAELVGNYYNQLLTTRSETIARTEILSAENAGRMQTWQDAIAAGLFGDQSPTKQWLVAPECCPICADLDGDEIGVDDQWDTELGSVDMPPLHPNCRCTAILVTPSLEAGTAPPELPPAEDVA